MGRALLRGPGAGRRRPCGRRRRPEASACRCSCRRPRGSRARGLPRPPASRIPCSRHAERCAAGGTALRSPDALPRRHLRHRRRRGRLERGELKLEDFYPAFERDCEAAGRCISARALMELVAAATVPRPAMLEAIRRIRAHGLAAAALTNNWITEDEGTGALRPHFDVFVESAALGLRKPDPRIFQHACDQLQVAPAAAVFLDDIGANLKAARALGMTTIKVLNPAAALAELEGLLGFTLG
ncbi:MAG: HAD family phosphatase [Deltaproteobacteria bacterium]|nr:MAG: HAD family phosphatase [Deltaproteobacteria bacterium]